MRVVGLDLSLTATGIADAEGGEQVARTRLLGMARLALLRDTVLDHCAGVDLVVIEGYSFNSRQGGEHLGELGGVVRLGLWEAQVPFVEVSPASLKMYATGKGNAGKAEVLVSAVRRLNYDGSDNNCADALWLRAMALDHYGEPVVTVPQSHRRGLEKVAWPVFDLTVND